MAGEVTTTGTRAADAARADAQQGTALDAEQAEAAVAAGVPGPRRAQRRLRSPAGHGRRRRTGEPGPGFRRTDGAGLRPRYQPGSAGQGGGRAEPGRRCGGAWCGRAAAAGPARSAARRGHQPGPRAAHQDRARDAPEGRHPAHRAGLRVGRLLAPGPEAAQRRPVHHPPARGGDHPGRARHEHRDDLRRAAARHGGRHPVHADRAARRVRRGRRRAGRRRHQAGQGQVRRVGRGRDRPQDGRRDVPRHPCAGHQARRPAAQHADAAVPAQGEAGAQVPGGPGDLRPARPPARHEQGEVGARGSRLRDAVPQAVRRDRPPGVQPGRRGARPSCRK